MNVHLTLLAASLVTFAVTNVDDICLLILLFGRRIPGQLIVAGQYIGFSAIILMSMMVVLLALAIPQGWSRILGVLPLALGVRELYIRTVRKKPTSQARSYGVASIALITLSNGADNVGVYVPFFLANRPYLWLILLCYGICVGISCFIGSRIGNHPLVLRIIDRWGHWLLPGVLMGLGLYILFV